MQDLKTQGRQILRRSYLAFLRQSFNLFAWNSLRIQYYSSPNNCQNQLDVEGTNTLQECFAQVCPTTLEKCLSQARRISYKSLCREIAAQVSCKPGFFIHSQNANLPFSSPSDSAPWKPIFLQFAPNRAST